MKTEKFEKLSKEVQEKIVQEQIEFNSETFEIDDWTWFIERVKEWGFEISEDDIRYQGFNSQGDGASFTGSIIVLKFIDKYNSIYDDLIEVPEDADEIDTVGIYIKDNFYMHENTCEVEKYNDIPYDLWVKIEDQRKEFSKDLYDEIYNMYANCTDEDKVRADIIDENRWYSLNGEEFFEDDERPIRYDYEIYLNDELIKEKDLPGRTIGKIGSLHLQIKHKLNYLHENVDEIKDDEKETIAGWIEELEFQLQECWQFPKDISYHYYWKELPGCTCPRLDNDDLRGTGMRIYDGRCPYHKHLIKEK